MRLARPTDPAGNAPSERRTAPRAGAERAGAAPAVERVALKDARFVYRACSAGFAEAIGRASPDEVIGRTDFELFPAAVAREQAALDGRVVDTGHADIGTIELSDVPGLAPGAVRHAMLVRSPVTAPDGTVRGVDLRLVGGPSEGALRSAVTIDYRTLVTEGLQGSLIFVGREFLFRRRERRAGAGLGEPRGAGRARRGRRRVRGGRAGAPGGRGPRGGDRPRARRRRRRAGRPRGAGALNARRATLLSFVEREPGAARAPGDGPAAGDAPERRRSRTAFPRRRPRRRRGRIADERVRAGRGVAGRAHRGLRARRRARAARPRGTGRRGRQRRRRRRGGRRSARRRGAWLRENAALRTAAARFRQYARAGADFFWEIDADLRFRRVSPELARTLGLPRPGSRAARTATSSRTTPTSTSATLARPPRAAGRAPRRSATSSSTGRWTARRA